MTDRTQNEDHRATDEDQAPSDDSASSSSSTASGFRRIKNAHRMAAQLRAGDGIDPRAERLERQRARTDSKPDYAAARLAWQISQCVNANLGIGLLTDFEVQSVSPGKGNHFIIMLQAIDPALVYDAREIQSAATARLPLLRAELSGAIHRKKVPNLSIRVLPPGQRQAV